MSRVKDFYDAIKIVKTLPGWIRKSKNFKSFDRDLPPLRGYLRSLDNWDEVLREIRVIKDLHFEWLESVRSKLTIPVYNSIREWETFQEKQKGPTAPLPGDIAFHKLIDDLIKFNQPFSIHPDQMELLSVARDLLESVLFPSSFKQESIVNINFESLLLSLPRGTVRGGPFWGKGREMDAEIIRVLGSSSSQVVKAFNATDFIICSSGYRISGSPYQDEAKFRLVFIPDMFYQYFVNGITHRVMNYLKRVPSFCGWLDPITRNDILSHSYLEVKNLGYELIQLDYSAYDKHIVPEIQIMMLKFYQRFFKDWDMVNENFKKKLSNQRILFFDYAGNPKVFQINNQLISGKSDTQLMGSLIGLTLTTAFLISKYGINEAKNLIPYLFQLGDDTLFPVKLSSDYTYEDVLEEYSQFCGKFGFTLNPKKAYPTQEPAFLQKLIRPDIGLKSAGTWQRTLMSFMFSEKFKTNEFGSTKALDIISQISILENAYVYSNDILNHFFSVFANFWLNRDESLLNLGRFLKQKSASKRVTSNELFFALVNLAGTRNTDDLLESLDMLSYDHKGLREKLTAKDFSDTFHILKPLVDILNSENYQGEISFESIVNDYSADHLHHEEELSKEILEI